MAWLRWWHEQERPRREQFARECPLGVWLDERQRWIAESRSGDELVLPLRLGPGWDGSRNLTPGRNDG